MILQGFVLLMYPVPVFLQSMCPTTIRDEQGRHDVVPCSIHCSGELGNYVKGLLTPVRVD